jgi:hypothetical protein
MDLHGLSVQEATKAVYITFQKAIEQGVTQIYFVTGYGSHVNSNGTSGVLKKILPKLFEPYNSIIEKIDKENAAYKILLKKNLTEDEKRNKQFIKTDFFKNILNEIKEEAKQGDNDAKLSLAAHALSNYNEDKSLVDEALKSLEAMESQGLPEAGMLLAEIFLEGRKVERNPKKAIQLLKKYENKSSDVKFLLAKTLLQGEGVIQAESRGRTLMLELAEINYPAACCSVGKSYIIGDYTEINLELGVKFLQRAAVQNFSPSFVDLAICYGSGRGIAQDNKLAIHFYKKATVINSPYAFYQLGRYYSIGKGVPVDLKISFEYFLKAAQLGDGDAQIEVALAYFTQMGVKRDANEGVKWLKVAAEKNHLEACYILGCLFLEGIIVPKDNAEGVKYLKISSKNKHPLAMFSLALAILSKTHTPAEYEYAFDLLKKSCSLTSDTTPLSVRKMLIPKNFALALMYFEGMKIDGAKVGATDQFAEVLLSLADILTSTARNEIPLGLLLAEHAAQLGHTDSEIFLCDTYLRGTTENIAKDEQKGILYLNKLVAKENPDALYILALANIDGRFGQDINREKSFHLMVKAASKGSKDAVEFMQMLQRRHMQNATVTTAIVKTETSNDIVSNKTDSSHIDNHIAIALNLNEFQKTDNTISNSEGTAKPYISKYVFAAAGAVSIVSALTYKYYNMK